MKSKQVPTKKTLQVIAKKLGLTIKPSMTKSDIERQIERDFEICKSSKEGWETIQKLEPEVSAELIKLQTRANERMLKMSELEQQLRQLAEELSADRDRREEIVDGLLEKHWDTEDEDFGEKPVGIWGRYFDHGPMIMPHRYDYVGEKVKTWEMSYARSYERHMRITKKYGWDKG